MIRLRDHDNAIIFPIKIREMAVFVNKEKSENQSIIALASQSWPQPFQIIGFPPPMIHDQENNVTF